MGQGFFGVNIALSGLYSAQRNLNIVNHNLSNANTPGYSRQQNIQQADVPMGLYDGTGMVGTGTDIVSVEQLRDQYLDYKYWDECSTYGEWEAKKDLLTEVEILFNEPSESGFNQITNDFFESLHELAKDPSSDAIRAVVREKAVTLTKYYNSTATHFERIQTSINNTISSKVSEVNSLAKQISEVNRQIEILEINQEKANDLRDQRNLLIDKLSKLVNVETSEYIEVTNASGDTKKRFIVSISGKAIVDGRDVSYLAVTPRKEKKNEEDVDGLYEVAWKDGNKLKLSGGELKGYLEVRDGNEGENGSPVYKGIPFYIKKFNQQVRTFAMAFNEGYIDYNNNGRIEINEDQVGHVDGYKKDSIIGDSPSGVRFFTYMDEEGDNITSSQFLDTAYEVINDGESTEREKIDAIYERYKGMTAKNFAVSQDLFENYSNISAASNPAENGNIEVVNELLSIRHNKELFAEGAPEDFMKSLISTLGIDTQQAIRLSSGQKNVVEHITNRRISVSGVSIDEEMADMVKFQHAYTASAKMISTMQEIYEVLLNKMGV